MPLQTRTIKAIHRKGKMLDFIFTDNSHLLSHLGMTGTWLVASDVNTLKPGKHTHLILEGEQWVFAYDDPRRFGHLYFYVEEEAKMKLDQLGRDLADPALDLDYLKWAILRYPERALKVTLLDQKLFAGTGNYIANEICARAGIRPTRLCKEIRPREFEHILRAIGEVLQPALAAGGTTFQGGYRDTSGEKGAGLEHLVVFWQKTCQLCKKNPVIKINLAQRGTYYCPKCQK